MRSVYNKKMYKLAGEIDSKLLATDKRFANAVQLIDAEGTVLFFNNAFIEEKDGYIFLFTEHHEYDVFCEGDLIRWGQYKRIGISKLKES